MFLRQSCALLMVLGVGSANAADLPPTHERQAPHTDRYGDLLPKGAIARLGTVRFRLVSEIKSAAVSPDGRIIAASSGWGMIYLWDATTGKELRRIATEGHRDVKALAFSPDSKTLASAGEQLFLWDVGSGKLVRQLGDGQQTLRSVAFASDGKTLASCGQDPVVRLWDPFTGRELHALTGHKDSQDGIRRLFLIDQVTFAPDGKTVASAGWDRTVRTWDVGSGKALHVYQADEACSSVAYSPDGKTLAFGDQEGIIILQETKLGGERRRIEAGGKPLSCLGFSSDGSMLAAGGGYIYSTLRLWDPATGKECKESVAAPRNFGCGIWLPQTKKLAMWCTNGSAFHLWDVAEGKSPDPSEGHFSRVGCFVVTPDGKGVVSTSSDGSIRYWDLATGRQIRCQNGTGGNAIHTVAISPDGLTIASAATDGILRLSAVMTRREMKQFKAEGSLLAYSKNGGALYVAGYRTVQELDAATGDLRSQFDPLREENERNRGKVYFRSIEQIILSPNGRDLFTTGRASGVFIWDLHTRRERRVSNAFEGQRGAVALSSDGRTLAGERHSKLPDFQEENQICLWETVTGKIRVVLTNKADEASALAFAPDGRTLATSCDRGDLVLVNVATGREIKRFKSQTNIFGIEDIVFSPDGKTVLTAESNGTILVWEVSDLPRKSDRLTLSKERLQEAWAELADDDADKAYRAIWTIAAAPDGVVMLREHMHPAPAPTAEALERCIRDLDSDEFSRRQAATTELTVFGEAAEFSIRKALQNKPSPEVGQRLENLLRRLEHDDLVPAGGLLRSLRGVEALEHSGSAEARQLLKELAQGAPETRLTREAKASLDRLAGRPR